MAEILAVDDSDSIRRVVSLTLNDVKYDVTTAVDGLDALNTPQTNQFQAMSM